MWSPSRSTTRWPLCGKRSRMAYRPTWWLGSWGLTEDETAEAEREYDRHLVGLLHEHAKSNWRAAAYLLEHQAKGETVTARGRLPLPPKLVVCRPKNQDTQSTDGDSQ